MIKNMNKIEFKGKGEKNILILTGVHGNELTPVYVGYLLNEYILKNDKNYDDNYHNLTLINAINIDGIRKNIRDVPLNNTDDLNRMFKTEVKEKYVDEIKELIDKNDVIIDIHSSPACTEFILLNNNEYSNSYVEFAEKFQIPYLLRFNNNDTIKKYCLEKGKISFTIEINKMNSIDFDSSSKCFNIIQDIFHNVNNFIYKIEEPRYEPYFEFFYHKEGLFIPNYCKKLGKFIENGDEIGECINLKNFNKDIIYYKNNINARIISGDDTSYINPNSPIYYLQPINKIL
jgi:succinylglutamate desuccinylase